MIPPRPRTYVCQKCGYIKHHAPKSDMIRAEDMRAGSCPKCHLPMKPHSNPVSAGLDSLCILGKKIFK